MPQKNTELDAAPTSDQVSDSVETENTGLSLDEARDAIAQLRKEQAKRRRDNKELSATNDELLKRLEKFERAEAKRKGDYDKLITSERDKVAALDQRLAQQSQTARDRFAASEARTALAALGITSDALAMLVPIVVAQTEIEWDADDWQLTGDFAATAKQVVETLKVGAESNGKTEGKPKVVLPRASSTTVSEIDDWKRGVWEDLGLKRH